MSNRRKIKPVGIKAEPVPDFRDVSEPLPEVPAKHSVHMLPLNPEGKCVCPGYPEPHEPMLTCMSRALDLSASFQFGLEIDRMPGRGGW